MAREYSKVIEEDYEPFEEEFLQKELAKVKESNKDSILQINWEHELEFRLKEIISISDEFDAIYREPMAIALYKQALNLLPDRVEYVSPTYNNLDANREFQMALELLKLVSVDFLTYHLRIEPSSLFDSNNRSEIIEKIRLLISGMIWTQSNVGKVTYDNANNKAQASVDAIIQKRMSNALGERYGDLR